MVRSGLLERGMTSSSGRRGADRPCLRECGVAWGGGCSFGIGRHAWSGMRHGGSWNIRSKNFWS